MECQDNVWVILDWKSSDMVRFDLWPLIQSQMRSAKPKRAYNSLIIGPRVLGC